MKVTAILVLLLALAAQFACAAPWPQWGGPARTGISAEVPLKLPARTLLWRRPLSGETHAGIATDGKYVIVPDRGQGKDIIRCFTPDGKTVWTYEYDSSATDEMPYGDCPRATPLIVGDRVYTFGAHGDLYCLDLKAGTVIWSRNLAKDFTAEVPQYGYCSSPLIADGKLLVNPGGEQASLVALNPDDGKVIWQTPGKPAAYAGFLVGTFGGVKQIVGYDRESLGGWELATGKRLWTLVPENTSDFNVGTPVNVNGNLLVATDANYARLFTFKADGTINPKPAAQNADLGPDMATPVIINGLAFCASYGFTCVDTRKGLKTCWKNGDVPELGAYASVIAGNNRVMVFTESGTLFLLATDPAKCTILGKLPLCQKTWSTPALADGKLYIRDAKWVYCFAMK